MAPLTETELAVLGVTASEARDLETIYEQLHVPPRPIPLAEAADAVRALVEKGLLSPRSAEGEATPDDLSSVWKARFEPTPLAREVLPEGPPPGWPPGRVYPGMFKGLIPNLPFEVFKENRREMAPKYGEDSGDE